MGSYSFHIPSWVQGNPDQTIRWEQLSGPGSITPEGVYTPPSVGDHGTSAVIVGTSNADPQSRATLRLALVPTGVNPIGAARFDIAANKATFDNAGNMWAEGFGVDGVTTVLPSDWPEWKSTNPATPIYESMSAAQNDISFTSVLPNGHYLVHLMFGVLYNGCETCKNSRWIDNGYYNQYSFNPQVVETQDDIKSLHFDFGVLAGYKYATPEDLYVPAMVTDNILRVEVEALAPDTGPNTAPPNGNKVNSLNGLEILPDSSSPHWVIDQQQQRTILPGSSLQLGITDYYTGSISANWSIEAGPGQISSTGVLSVLAGTYPKGISVTVKATSSVNPNISADATLCVGTCLQTGANKARVNPFVRTLKSFEQLVVWVVKKVGRGLARLV